ncbi:MAG: glutamyl-tRNA reductase [Nitrosopumilaceae archaeon]|nr:glutamyl-tRNA reductase [Nitrosopumilaceae archaeon]
MNNVINLRVTFRNSPIHILEKFTFKDIGKAYKYFKKYSELDEFIILQTCNRIEIFGLGKNYDVNKIKKLWFKLIKLTDGELHNRLETSENDYVYQHLLKITSGIDSMVIGEEQILHQIKESVIIAKKMKCIGTFLNSLLDKSIKMGIEIRKHTGINKNGGTSIGTVATKIAESNVNNLSSKKILLIGTGMASTIIAKSLKNRKYDFFVISRNFNHAKLFTKNIGGKPLQFNEKNFRFDEYDVIFVVVSTATHIIKYKNLIENNNHNEIIILDLSNPRAVDEKISTLQNIKLINLDQISNMVYKNMKSGMQKTIKIKKIINKEMIILRSYMNRLEAEPTISEIFRSTNKLRIRELNKALKMLDEKDDTRIKIINELTKSIIECVLSKPMNNLRQTSEIGNFEVINIIKKMFDYN